MGPQRRITGEKIAKAAKPLRVGICILTQESTKDSERNFDPFCEFRHNPQLFGNMAEMGCPRSNRLF